VCLSGQPSAQWGVEPLNCNAAAFCLYIGGWRLRRQRRGMSQLAVGVSCKYWHPHKCLILCAVGKGNQAALIASVAADIAAPYSWACSQVRGYRRRQRAGGKPRRMLCMASYVTSPMHPCLAASNVLHCAIKDHMGCPDALRQCTASQHSATASLTSSSDSQLQAAAEAAGGTVHVLLQVQACGN
jgi:hypothetical protein